MSMSCNKKYLHLDIRTYLSAARDNGMLFAVCSCKCDLHMRSF
jgi:hypothetical protein